MLAADLALFQIMQRVTLFGDRPLLFVPGVLLIAVEQYQALIEFAEQGAERAVEFVECTVLALILLAELVAQLFQVVGQLADAFIEQCLERAFLFVEAYFEARKMLFGLTRLLAKQNLANLRQALIHSCRHGFMHVLRVIPFNKIGCPAITAKQAFQFFM